MTVYLNGTESIMNDIQQVNIINKLNYELFIEFH